MNFGMFLKWAELVVGMVEGRMHRDLDLNDKNIDNVKSIGGVGGNPVVFNDKIDLTEKRLLLHNTYVAQLVADANEVWWSFKWITNGYDMLTYSIGSRALYVRFDGANCFAFNSTSLDLYDHNIKRANIVEPAKARAYLSTVMNDLTSGTSYKVLLDAESWDPGNNFDSTTNHRFVAPKSGYYLVCAGIQYASVVADKVYYLQIKGNSIATRYARYHSSIAENLMVNFSDIVYLNEGDYIELWALHYAGVNTVDIGIGEGSTFLAVSYISS